jgi:sirohydrochlorin cobaltochelatase
MYCVILFAHGSRDPLWHRPVEAVATRMRALAPHVPVRCAYLELSTPALPDAAAELVAAGATAVRIVPMFLGTGRHAREDLPALVAQLRADHPATVFELPGAVGEDTRVIELLASMALEPTRLN